MDDVPTGCDQVAPSSGHEIDHSMKKCFGGVEQAHLNVGTVFGTEFAYSLSKFKHTQS